MTFSSRLFTATKSLSFAPQFKGKCASISFSRSCQNAGRSLSSNPPRHRRDGPSRPIRSLMLIAVVVLFSTAFSPAAFAQRDTALLDCQEGPQKRGISESRFIDSCGAVLRRNPNSLPYKDQFNKLHAYSIAMHERARALVRERRYDEAIAQYLDYLRFIDRDPKQADMAKSAARAGATTTYWTWYGGYHLELGFAYLLSGRLDKATEFADAFDQLICAHSVTSFWVPCKLPEELPGQFSSAELRADIDMQRGQYQRARNYYEYLLKKYKERLAYELENPNASIRTQVESWMGPKIPVLETKLTQATRMITQPAGSPPPIIPSSEACKLFPNLC